MTTPYVTVGVNGSIIAVRALDRAAREAELRGAALDIVYAVPDTDEAGPILASAVTRTRERHPRLPVTASAAEGGAVQALLRHGRDAALTVVGARGLGTLAGLVLGSVSLRMAAYSHGPLLVVGGDHRPHGGDVLLGLESDADADVAAFAFEEAVRRGAGLRILHAWGYPHLLPEQAPPIPTRRVADELARHARTEQAVPRFAVAALREKYADVEVQTRTVRSGPVHALLEATREAAVVVVGGRRRPGLAGPPRGPVTHALLHRSHCPVLFVPTGHAGDAGHAGTGLG
ncbi:MULTISPECIES: universal stress protein [Streptomyces]|uniref:Universal stress protein n=1 Tax=Streptomyces ortus TaxID=2867268 RepID=A0ABT3V5F3_9ACTN|nr:MULTISPECIES: universal stress protein [Streptomyces]MCX4234801.1 universal stress protein [Streptomyces ortus]